MVMPSVDSPPGPVAIIVYVVVTMGSILMDPFVSTGPIPLSMLTLSACVVVQASKEKSPAIIISGSAEILTVGG